MESPSLPLSRYVQIARPAVRWPAKRVGCTNSVPSNAPTTHNLLLGRGDEQLLCVEWAQTPELTIEAPPPPPPPPPPRPRYEASVRSIHPGAVTPGGTYLGDTVRVRFRNATARPADAQGTGSATPKTVASRAGTDGSSGARGTHGGCGSRRRWLATRAVASAATLSSRGGSRGGSWPGNGSGSSTTCDARMGGRALDTARSRQTRAACSPSPPTARAPLS